VLGTAFPHLLHGLETQYDWRFVIGVVSVLAALGGLMIFLFVPDGPYRTKATSPDLKLVGRLFRNKGFRSAAFGYFGHMWELYTFWALVPTILSIYLGRHPGIMLNIPLTSFAVIAMGSIGCVIGGYIALKKGSNPVAFTALFISFICCLTACFIFDLPLYVFVPVLMLWAMAVITDSPQFTTMVAQSVAVHEKGTALLITNSIGFSLTIFSIQFITSMQQVVGETNIYFLLAIGPLLGLLSMRFYKKRSAEV
jgi:predicted MFS family arabinose efflux permease